MQIFSFEYDMEQYSSRLIHKLCAFRQTPYSVNKCQQEQEIPMMMLHCRTLDMLLVISTTRYVHKTLCRLSVLPGLPLALTTLTFIFFSFFDNLKSSQMS